MSNPTRDESLSLLRWLIEAGADEAIADTPVNRFARAAAAPLPEASSRQGATTRSTLPPAFAEASAGKQGEGGKFGAASSLPPAFAEASAGKQGEGGKTSAEAVSLSTVPGAARALAASCTTLAELKTALGNFDGFELKRFAKNTVFADGTPEGRIMLIGEAPGRDEDEQGLPFVGRAGQLLDRMLAGIGLDRRKVYITNVLNWRPPQNRDPSPEEAAAFLPFLQRHIEPADPKLLILLRAVST